MALQKATPVRKKSKKRKKYRKHTLNFELLVEKNKREIMRNQEQMEQIYIKIDEKHAGVRSK
ncbi:MULTISPECIES: FbpB family small basic protein [Bacillus]|uniref:Transcriptional regulator (Activator) n=1 Tax=Bacillus amyloliquefaciens (strain ATCC 23350 / DSM 7 / BCRC 11601 / CCUG 28519 / NBRC 15535 / NRRL B-14393 / F) TaxID=692420 RepID=A0A9P1NGS1_BACAS|nr:MULTISPECIES: FbpB family small basic protein [Bacillus amyloliquefaciens group]AIW32869.1 transcriptional regulator [Bacillus subtilis]AEB22993.1 transcriptional regulator (activator) [Bacillus amyloliquefaciens TA208]AEK87989.1 transcriptional regulatory protein [Bacillus amyloliquefaciens XH7]ARW38123.1 Transcriptional regulatory protein SenN [Bacillus amyloliquefaciens]ASF28132.1 transcriptional regulator [Bacillus amyloliquefaciens]